MKHIVFIVGSYHPNYSAVGSCAHQVIKCLKDEFRITVLAIRGDIKHPKTDELEGVNIVRVDTHDRTVRLRLAAGAGRFDRLKLQFHRLYTALKKIASYTSIEQQLVIAYLQELERLSSKPDVLIPLVFPIESAIAAQAYKKIYHNTLIFPYLFDNFVDSRSLHVLDHNRRFKTQRHIEIVRSLLLESDAVLAMHPLRSHFSRHFDKSELMRVHYLEHPLLIPPTKPNNSSSSIQGKLTVCFTGSLIRGVVEPDYLLKLLRALPLRTATQFNFCVMGNNAHKIPNQLIGNFIEIINHGRVSKDIATEFISKSNLLLNLGEIHGKQMSSKVFEYMATGKPIIHLAYVENDSVSAVLGKYPLALCLVQTPERLTENAARCSDFIEMHSHSQLKFDEVEALYPEARPSATADLMRILFANGQQ